MSCFKHLKSPTMKFSPCSVSPGTAPSSQTRLCAPGKQTVCFIPLNSLSMLRSQTTLAGWLTTVPPSPHKTWFSSSGHWPILMANAPQNLPVPNSSIVDRIVQVNDGAPGEHKLLSGGSTIRHQAICPRKQAGQRLAQAHLLLRPPTQEAAPGSQRVRQDSVRAHGSTAGRGPQGQSVRPWHTPPGMGHHAPREGSLVLS